MSGNNKIFDDLAKVAGSAIGSFVNIKNDIKSYIDIKIESYIKSKDFVSRQEFEVVKQMVQEARAEQMRLSKKNTK